MSGQLNVSVLVAAKTEYLNQIKIHLEPLIREGFISIWEDSDQNRSNFQSSLSDIPNWNQSILEQETKRIFDQCEFLTQLITAVFIAYVKILASVRLGNNDKNIRISIPQEAIFIHKVYINAAKIIFENTELFESPFERHNYNEIKNIIENSIEITISSLIPVGDILQQYLSDSFHQYIQKEDPTSSTLHSNNFFPNSPPSPPPPPIDLPQHPPINLPQPIDLPQPPPIDTQPREIPFSQPNLFGETNANDGGIGDFLSATPPSSPTSSSSNDGFNFFGGNDNNII